MSALIDRLPAISLEELNATAALQTRVDRKYILPHVELDSALAALPAGTRALEVDGVRSARYASMYFDTVELSGYLGAARRRRRRFKVRTRSYLDSEQCFLEVKTPGARSTTVKERQEHPFDAREELGEAGRAYADELLAVADVEAADLMPVLETRYRRSTLHVPGVAGRGASRATVDLELEWQLVTGETMTLPELAIVETKSGPQASPVDRLLWRAGHRPVSISKYATGMAALVPGLPANKWAPVLRRWFPAAEGPATAPIPLRRAA
ncbi:MAG: VTC domain-containing protein [Microbacteriaceae bacterium]